MQNSNDNEIVQYLGVKHIINYLVVQVGLTQTLHFEGYLEYYVWGIWSRGGHNVCVCVCRGAVFGSVCVLAYTHMFACGCAVWKCVYACVLTYASGY